MRISDHNLHIESGRYGKNRKAETERTCPFCPSKVENKSHFLLECPKYSKERKSLTDKVEEYVHSFTSMNIETKFKMLMKANNCHFLLEFAIFIKQAMKIRKSYNIIV